MNLVVLVVLNVCGVGGVTTALSLPGYRLSRDGRLLTNQLELVSLVHLLYVELVRHSGLVALVLGRLDLAVVLEEFVLHPVSGNSRKV